MNAPRAGLSQHQQKTAPKKKEKEQHPKAKDKQKKSKSTRLGDSMVAGSTGVKQDLPAPGGVNSALHTALLQPDGQIDIAETQRTPVRH